LFDLEAGQGLVEIVYLIEARAVQLAMKSLGSCLEMRRHFRQAPILFGDKTAVGAKQRQCESRTCDYRK
jgi:hypothetical protein